MSDSTPSKTIQDSATAGASHDSADGRPLTGHRRFATSLTAKFAILAVTFIGCALFLYVVLGRGDVSPASAWRVAIVVLAFAAAVSLWAVFDIRQSLRRFAHAAEGTHTDAGATSLVSGNVVAELAPVAEEFDRLARTVRESASELRDAAEENAHAFKTPIAVISQSLEPLRRSIPEDDVRGRRALQLIERSVDRLDSLVGAARHMDEILASLLDMPRERVNLSALLTRMLHAYRDRMTEQGVALRMELAPGVVVQGGEENIEVVVEHLIENAASFSPKGGAVAVTLTQLNGLARLVVEDEGPGVDPRNFIRIFDRYFTHRPGRDGTNHFGIGLWVVRRNVTALGGTVAAANRTGQGLVVTVTLPLVA